ncbi:MAG TPA: hypothetical protein VJ970_03820, partial [Flavobacteriaceae bacterium]|nr:hypothetical protein [Flavobacteriaceae bacterium]
NKNKIYNPETDKIGFIEKPITIPIDTPFEFPVFKEVPEFKILKASVVKSGHIIFGFEGNADEEEININLATTKPINFKSVVNFEKEKDTINYWYTPFESDSLVFKTSAKKFEKNFTVKTRNKEIDSLKVTPNVGKTLHLNDTLKLITNTPIINVDTTKIKLSKKKDSIYEVVNIKSILSKSKNELLVNFEKENKSIYKLEVLPKSITDIYTTNNDSINITFNRLEPEAYGNLIIGINSNLDENFIVEIIDDKSKIVSKKSILKTETAVFQNLRPGIYYARVIVDSNKNGKWDTGNFLKTIQPEVIRFNNKQIDLRANWEVSETFTVN